jgi:hypothetical protein
VPTKRASAVALEAFTEARSWTDAILVAVCSRAIARRRPHESLTMTKQMRMRRQQG